MMNTDVQRMHSMLLPFRDGRIPEMLGNFQLDDHNVEEWSDTTDPTLKYHTRKEIGKWVDADRNADIQFQRHEDVKTFGKGQENQRTEIVQGTAPDSNFEIVRTERQFNDSENNGHDQNMSRVSSTSTSYQMNSSRGIRSTSKTTSNKTTTKSVSISTGKTDDFENLKIPLYPLDTSTQRERIHISRSGTMGSRRPPTRKQPTNHQANDKEQNMVTTNIIIPESTNNSIPVRTVNEVGELSILGYNNISPKIRVGFPVEIQVELRTKLKGKDMDGNDDEKKMVAQNPNIHHEKSLLPQNLSTTLSILRQNKILDSTTPKESEISKSDMKLKNNYEISETGNFFKDRRKSYGFESFDSHSTQLPKDSFSTSSTSFFPFTPASSKPSLSQLRNEKIFTGEPDYISYTTDFTPSAISRSWDFIEKLESPQKLDFKKYTAQPDVESQDSYYFSSSPIIEPISIELSQKKIETKNSEYIGSNDYRLDSLEETSSLIPIMRLTHPSSRSEPSREYAQLLDEDNDDTMFNTKLSNWETEWEKTKSELERLKETLSSSGKGTMDEYHHEFKKNGNGNTKSNINYYPILQLNSRNYFEDDNKRKLFDGMGILSSGGESLGRYTNLDMDRDNPNNSKHTQISQTWISSIDLQKPSRHAHDNELSTSISATSDPFKKNLKKVEFSKTEVHFTPEPGRFHIVESAENKPSTVHLFRRRKRKTSLEGGQTNGVTLVENEPDEMIGVGESEKNQMFAKRVMTLEKSTMSQDLETSSPLTNGKYEDENNFYNSLPDNSANHLPQKGEDALRTPILLSPLQSLNFDEFIGSHTSKGGNDEEDILEIKEFSDMDYDGYVTHPSPTSPTVRNYEELKIQKYLKQLKPPSRVVSPLEFNNNNNNGINYAHNEYLMNEVRTDYDDDEDSLHFRYGSFVPLATRRSLIEMNNRNRIKRSNYTTNSHISDNSSTRSNYSLPHSERSRDIFENPLKLSVMEAMVAATASKPQITSLELSYSIDGKDKERQADKPQRLPNNERQHQLSQIPSPVLPSHLRSMPPYRSGRHSYSSSPTREITSFRQSKPPTPILPLHFSTFEKTGEALRNRFFSKNPQCGCNVIKEQDNTKEAMTTQDVNAIPENESKLLGLLKSVRPMTSVVNIGTDENSEKWKIDDDVIEVEPFHSPIINNKGIVRSLTFPKSSRSEPEWVSKARAKARNREIHGTDWALIGQRYSGNSESVPLWISELKIKSHGSSGGDDLNSFRKSSFIYPWPRDNGNKEVEIVTTNENEIVRDVENISETGSSKPYSQHCMLNDPEETTYESICVMLPSAAANNKSIVDLNRDSESVLINPNQIVLSPTPRTTSDQKSKLRKTINPPLKPSASESDSTLRGSHPRRISKTEKIILPKQSEVTLDKVRNSKVSITGGEHGNSTRKPLQTSTSVNQTLRPETHLEDGKRNKLKTQLKPPKPPQRISSLVMMTPPFNVSADKTKCTPLSGKTINNTNNPEEAESSNTSSVILHRHPTVKVSKLPMRTNTSSPVNKHNSSLEEKDSSKSSRTKAHVSLIAEAKRLYKGKQSDEVSSTKELEVGGKACSPQPLKSSRSPTSTVSPHHQRKR